jgi:hypothetical protein
MNQSFSTSPAKISFNSSFLTETINKISTLVAILQESSAEANAHYKKHSILGGGWE